MLFYIINISIATNLDNYFNYKNHGCKLLASDSESAKQLQFCRKNGKIISPPTVQKITEIICNKNCHNLKAGDLLPYTNLKSLYLNYTDVSYVNMSSNLLMGKFVKF